MYAVRIIIFAGLASFSGVPRAMSIEEAPYQVVVQDGRFEVREYAAQLLAVTRVDGSLEDAGDEAFGRLFRFISGENRGKTKIAMTAPVGQEPAGDKIAMTAPVSQEPRDGQWEVSFMMPSSYTRASLPEPSDTRITIREVPARRMAAIRYSGFWSEKGYRRHLSRLEDWMEQRTLRPAGDPVWARYNPPFMPWFLRRNEILVPLAGEGPAVSGTEPRNDEPF